MSRRLLLAGISLAALLIAGPVAAQTLTPPAGGSATPGTGTGLLVGQTSPNIITPTLGVATVTSVNKVTVTPPATGSTLTIADGKTLTISNSLQFAGTDGQLETFPTTSATIARTDAAQTFTGVQTFGTPIAVGSGGSGVANTGNLTWNAAQTFSFTSGQTMTFPAASATLAGLGTVQSFTAAQTNSTAGAASTPAEFYTGAPYTAGSATTNFPLVYIQTPGATAVNQFGAGTAFGINIHAASVADIMDLYSDNNQRLLLTSGGNLTITGVMTVPASGRYTFSGRSAIQSSLDKEIQFLDNTLAQSFTFSVPTASTQNVLQLGHLNAASPVAQTVQVQGSRGGTDTNVAGGNLTLNCGLGTGNATGCTTIFQTGHAGSTGTTAQTATSQLVLGDNTVSMPALASSSAATTGTMCWTSGGNINVDTTVACLASDMRLKEKMVPLTDKDGLAEVMALKPFAYNLKYDPKGDGRMVGLGAQDVQKVDPRLVSLYGAGPDKGTPSGVRYMQLTAVLVKAIQQQQAQIKGLQRQIATLQRAHH